MRRHNLTHPPSSSPARKRKKRPPKKAKRAQLQVPVLIQACGLIAVLVFAISLLVLHAYLPNVEHIKQEVRSKYDEDADCPAYGCPVYPLEKDSGEVQKLLQELKQASSPSFHTPPYAWPTGTTVTYQSNQHDFNQDRAFIIRPFHTHQTAHLGMNESFLLAILDGHGVLGHELAEYVSKELPRLIAMKLDDAPAGQDDEWTKQQLIDSFLEVNQKAPKDSALRGGCTASVTLRVGSKLYFANVGDSQTLLVTASRSSTNYNANNPQDPANLDARIIYKTRRDKANLPDEKARIQGLGGKIHIPPQNPNLSRVIVHSKAAIPPESIGLAMSRSIGDWEWKEVGVTAEPIVDVIDVKTDLPAHGDNDKNDAISFVLAASDGLWDLRKKEFLARNFAKHFLQFDDTSNNLLQRSADIIEKASPKNEKWYRDDITVVVAQITP